jgi:hypothetical protein
MEFKKLNKLQQWYLKYTDKPSYKQYKKDKDEYVFNLKFYNQKHSSLNHLYKAETTFKHSGNSGDIIYALPTIYALSKNGRAHILLQLNQKGLYSNYHPLGALMLNQKMADMLKPLLLFQPQIATCDVYNNEAVDYDLDEFRDYPILLDKGNICRWYFYVYAINYPLHEPWLTAPTDVRLRDYIVVARSHRYRSPFIDYGFLQQYSNLIFIGVKEEYEDMKKMIPNIEFREVENFLEMATIINSCKLFIGNQSFPFSIAEALKVNRLLEVFYKSPNVIVEGKGANDFMYQPQFEYLVKKLVGE